MEGPGFLGFGPGAIRWFEGLEADNSKAYFDATRPVYEAEVRGPLAALLDEAAARLGGTVKMFRQNRDVRFSKDKSPYKVNCYGVVMREGRPGLYAAISARGLYAATGMHDPAKDQLARFRDAVADEATGPALAEALDRAVAQGVEVAGEALATAPRGFPKDHPRVDLLRRKALLLGRRIGPAETLDGRRPFDFAMESWAILATVCDWLVEHVGESEIPPEVRFGGGRGR